jgi:AcrR family transcriptional regulator
MAPKAVDKEEKTRQIINHATFVFAERGYNATTVDAIAERAGISKGSVYQYFKSKSDLFFAVFETQVEEYLSVLSDSVPSAGLTAEEQIRRATSAACAMAATVEDLFPLTFEFWAASASSEFRDRFADIFRRMYAQFRQFFAGIIRRGIEEGEFAAGIDVEATTAVLVGSFDGLFLQSWFDKEMDPIHAGNAFIDVFVRGLRAVRTKAGGGYA